ncbi:MAG TPA: flagellar motor protein MotB [Candidatus Angelobacter sp.]|nr:flagellar motor protein MotB [Candidatus Angelobacter sp.]
MSRRSRRHATHVNHERWLVSYADFITLLFAVFVVMYAAAQVDNRRMGELSHAIQHAFKDMGVFQAEHDINAAENLHIVETSTTENSGNADGDLRNLLSSALAEEIKQKKAELRDGPDGLVISLHEIGFYDQGSDVLKEASAGTLERVTTVLKPVKLHIRIEGHTDNVPIHNARFASNWELSAARATGMVRTFVERYSMDPELLSAAGYAEYHPLQPNTTAEGRSQNRRVDIVVLDSTRHMAAPDKVPDLKQLQSTLKTEVVPSTQK